MTAQPVSAQDALLQRLDRQGRRRGLQQRSGIDFSSNDYLGLAASKELWEAALAALARGVPVGSGGSRLLRGNHPEHELLEEEAALFFRSEKALYFSSGYGANLAVLSALPQAGDVILHDALVHASAHAGMTANRRVKSISVPHNDVTAFEDALRKWRQGNSGGHPWIVVESLYSMDGDRAPLPQLTELAGRYDAILFVDEAHATGVFGENGRGLSANLAGHDNLVVLHTCGKALGCSGALVSCSQVFRDVLVNRAGAFIYSTAPSPLQAAIIRSALHILQSQPQRRQNLLDMITHANRRMDALPGSCGSGSQILPVILGKNGRAVQIANRMQAEGFDIRAIRPPTVPHGTARLRISVTLNADIPIMDRMFDTLTDAFEDTP